jgi:hypothetical protein
MAMMSGSSRRAARRARAKELVCRPTWRWFTTHDFEGWMYSIGSSMLMMWSWRASLTMLSSAARVEDLPQPAGPVSSTRPWW